MDRTPKVTVCVPVCEGASFVAETLLSISQQTSEDFIVLVSDDASEDDSVEVCRVFTSDARFHLIQHSSRLGWVDHCNWLLARARTEYVCIVSHDDLLEPGYLASLRECLDASPTCSLAFCDLSGFGIDDGVLTQPTISGNPFERLSQ